MPRYRTAYNVTDRPVIIDDEGRQVAGGEYGPVLASSEQVKAAVARGVLTFVDAPANDEARKGMRREPLAAFDATAALNEADGPEELADVADDVDATPTPAARKAAAAKKEA